MADDFYEDDEPVADVLAAFEAGEKVTTRKPVRGYDARSRQTVRFEGNFGAEAGSLRVLTGPSAPRR